MTRERWENDDRQVSHLTIGQEDTVRAQEGQQLRKSHSQIGSHDDVETVPPVELAFEKLGVLDGLFW